MHFLFRNLKTNEFVFKYVNNENHVNGFGNDLITTATGDSKMPDYEKQADTDLLESISEEKFIYSIENNDLNVFMSLVDNVDMNYRNGLALILAFYHKRNEMIKILLTKNVDLYDLFLGSLLRYNDDLQIFKLLFEYTNGEILNLYDSSTSVLDFIIIHENIEMLKTIYMYHPYSIKTKNYYENALLIACIYGSLDTVKFLEDIGVNLKSFNEELLSIASYHGHINIIEFLLNRELNVHACNDKALVSAINRDNVDIAKLLIMNGADYHADDNSPIYVAVDQDSVGCVKLLVEYDSDILLIKDKLLIFLAVKNNNIGLLEYFINLGIDITLPDNYLWIHATTWGGTNLIKLLVKYKIDIQYGPDHCIEYVCVFGDLDVIKILLESEIVSKNKLIEIAEKCNNQNIKEYLNKLED